MRNVCVEWSNRALEKNNQPNKALPPPNKNQKTQTKNPTKPTNSTKTAATKNPPQPICCSQLYYSSLGLFPHVRTELIKRSALESILFILHSIL